MTTINIFIRTLGFCLCFYTPTTCVYIMWISTYVHVPKWEVNMRNFHIFKFSSTPLWDNTKFKIFHWNDGYELKWFIGTQQLSGVTRSNRKSQFHSRVPHTQLEPPQARFLLCPSVVISLLQSVCVIFCLPSGLYHSVPTCPSLDQGPGAANTVQVPWWSIPFQ